LVTATVKVTAQAGDGELHWRFSDGSTSDSLPAPAPGRETTLTIGHRFAGTETAVWAEVVTPAGRVLDRWTGTVEPTGEAARRRTGLASNERAVAMLAGVLAVGSGMVALYLRDATWGSAGDYVTALLWGSATAEGVRAVVNIASNRWPNAS
jgi:hypothetical protein